MNNANRIQLRFPISLILLVGLIIFFVSWVYVPNNIKFYEAIIRHQVVSRRYRPQIIYDFPRGEISPVLHAQALSHFSLHGDSIPRILAAVAGSPKTILIAGVEWGKDVQNFAQDGYRVIAFEPMPKFYKNIANKLKKNPSWNVMIHNLAAGNETSQLSLNYRGMKHIVKSVRIDDVVSEDVSVFSADVQGNEYDIFLGANQLLKNTIKVSWFEALSCNDKVVSLLNFLDENFVLFDFVPVGTPRSQVQNGWRSRENFLFNSSRPSDFEGFKNWLCEFRSNGFRNVQTDILAVRRDIISESWPTLETIGDQACSEAGSRCNLRALLPRLR